MTDPTDLYYDVRGVGPVLLVIPGGAGHPMGFDALTDRLAKRFTVVTYDPLGLAHGRLGLPVGEQSVTAWSEGAHRVLGEVLPDGESAYVFGTSSGAIAALDLLARRPERLRRVVAHEPPVVEVLPDADVQRAMFAEVYDVYRAAGLGAGAARLGAGLEERAWTADRSLDSQRPSADDELTKPMALFLTRVLGPFTAYMPDTTALKQLPGRLVLGAGVDSRGRLLHRTATLVSELSGGEFVEFPGGHIGVAEHPADFAELLARTLLSVTVH
ncbi:alpha/beta hydrolase [Streptomyces sp. NPDC005485]|uniref:alpha/beta fold hydrolase n=1 Tax=Streptomyces sp. NPDC005485 TaxID=3155591 RepID=UPI0033B10ADF